jgi:glycerophosphoryl diester phosphodiesterase
MNEAEYVPQEIELIAHRGESYDAPENTLAAFRLAFERCDTAIELDVHLAADGELIVCHDPDTLRTTGVKKVIRETTLQELQKLEAGSWKGPQWAEEKLPALEEVLAELPHGKRCFVEIKTGPESLPALERLVRRYQSKDAQIVIISFEADTIASVKRSLPFLEAHLLSWFEHDKLTLTWSPTAQNLIDYARSIGADGLGVEHTGPVDESFVRQVKLAGLKLYSWTVDEVDRAQQLIAAGVDGITSNRAAWLREQIDGEVFT